MTDQNPKLKEKLLTEVIFEIRFLPTKDITLIIGNMFEKLKSSYPNFKNLNNDIPEGFPDGDKFVKYRIFSQDNQNLYSLGNGILSVNTLNYDSFEKYLLDIKKIIEIHKEMSELKTITRIGLRYINKIKNEGSLEDKINIKVELPKIIKDNQLGINLKTSSKLKNNDIINFGMYTEQYKNDEVFIDLDYSTESSIVYDIDNITSWLNTSHSTVYKIFKDCLTEKYFKKIS